MEQRTIGKRLLAALLSVVMVCSLCFPALAEDPLPEWTTVGTLDELQVALSSDKKLIQLTQDITVEATASGDTSSRQALTIPAGVTLDGGPDGHTLTVSGDFGANENVLGVIGAKDVTISNLTIDGAGANPHHGINIYGSQNVELRNVTVKNCSAAGITVNGSTVEAWDVNTSGNGWGGINVDQDGSLTYNSGKLEEPFSIWVDDGGSTNNVTVTGGDLQGVYAQGKDGNFSAIAYINILGGTVINVGQVYKDAEGEYIETVFPNVLIFIGPEATVTNKNPVAEINGTRYSSLQAALDNAQNGDVVKLLTYVSGFFEVSGNKEITLELVNTNSVIDCPDGGNALTVQAGSTLTITGQGELNTYYRGSAALVNYGTVTLDGIKCYCLGGYGSFEVPAYLIRNQGTMVVDKDTTIATVVYDATLIENGAPEGNNEGASLTINGGTFGGDSNFSYAIRNYAGATITDGDFRLELKNNGGGTMAITGGTFTADVKEYVTAPLYCVPNADKSQWTVQSEPYATLTLQPKDAVLEVGASLPSTTMQLYVLGDIRHPQDVNLSATADVELDGDSIKIKPNNLSHNIPAYYAIKYAVGNVTRTDAPTDVVYGAPQPTAAPGVDQALAAAVAEALKPTSTSDPGLTVEGKAMDDVILELQKVNTITVNDQTVQDKINDSGVSINTSNAKIVIQPYIDVQIQGVDIEQGSGELTLTLDITPKYNKVVTNNPNNIQTEGNGANAVVLEGGQPLTISGPVEVSIPLPTDWQITDGTTVYIRHNHNGVYYDYPGVVYNNMLTFTNPNGFSQFAISTTPFPPIVTAAAPAAPAAPAAAAPAGNGFTVCPACGHHDWTETAEGYRCNDCGYILPWTAGKPVANLTETGLYQPTAAQTKTSLVPATGDESEPMVWVVLMALGAVSLGAVLALGKKRRFGK